MFDIVANSIQLIKIVSSDGYKRPSLINLYYLQTRAAFKILFIDYKYLFLIAVLLPISIKKTKPMSFICAAIFIVFANIVFTKERFFQGQPTETYQQGRLFIFSILIIVLVIFLSDLSTKITIKHIKCFDKITQIRQQSKLKIIKNIKCLKDNFLLQKILIILIILPFIHTAGSNNDIFTGSSLAVLSWILVIVVLAVQIEIRSVTRYVFIFLAIFSIWGMHIKILDGFLEKPYRLLSSPKNLNKTVDGLPNVSNIKFDKATVD